MRTTTVFTTLLLALAVPMASATPITVDGDLTLTDNLVNPPTKESKLAFEEATGGNPDTQFFWQTNAGAWIWEYGSPTATRMMRLDSNHKLSLWNSSGTEKIILDPAVPSITVDGNKVLTVSPNNAGSADSFLREGTYLGSGSIPQTGAGTRMMWFPEKAAFRAGQSGGTAWDMANVGGNSAAFGFGTRAKGGSSFAAGSSAIADGDISVSLGNQTKATGNYSFAANHKAEANADNAAAFGYNTRANALASFAAGSEAHATADYAVAMGHKTKAWKAYATALGTYSIADGMATFAAGYTARAMANYAFATGFESTAWGVTSAAMGYRTNAYGDYSLTTGIGTTMNNYCGTVIGRYNENRHTPAGTAITTWQGDANHSVFEVGVGTSTTPKNALTVLQDGTVDIDKIPAKGGISMGAYQ